MIQETRDGKANRLFRPGFQLFAVHGLPAGSIQTLIFIGNNSLLELH